MVLADSTRFRPQDAAGWKPGLAMALFAHLLLVGALALGVHWKIQPHPGRSRNVDRGAQG